MQIIVFLIVLILCILLVMLVNYYGTCFVVVTHPNQIKIAVIDGIDEIGLYAFPFENGVLTINDNYTQLKTSEPLNEYYYNKMLLHILVNARGITSLNVQTHYDVSIIKTNYRL